MDEVMRISRILLEFSMAICSKLEEVGEPVYLQYGKQP